MLIIPLIILAISIDGSISRKNSRRNDLLVLSSCQSNNSGLESTRRNSHPYYLRFSNHFLSSSLPLFYCEHQQTTHYSSSGFAILHSSPRFFATNIDNPEEISSFHHYNHAASPSVLDRFSSIPIHTLMSSNENRLLVNNHFDNTTTTTTIINSFFSSSTTTTVSNVSLIQTTQQGSNRTFNIALLIGCISAGVILIIIIIYALVKYRNRDEGSYKIDESKNFITTPHLDHHDNGGCGGKISSSTHHRPKLLVSNEPNGVDCREWYV